MQFMFFFASSVILVSNGMKSYLFFVFGPIPPRASRGVEQFLPRSLSLKVNYISLVNISWGRVIYHVYSFSFGIRKLSFGFQKKTSQQMIYFR